MSEQQDGYNSLTKNIVGFEQCSVWSKLDNILNGVPKKKPQYLVFVNSQRKPQRDNEKETEESEKGIGMRRQALKGRKSKSSQDVSPGPVPKATKKGRSGLDPEFAFVYSSGCRTMDRLIMNKTKQLSKSGVQTQDFLDEEEEELSVERSDLDMAAAEKRLAELENASDSTAETAEEMDTDEPSSQEHVLSDALSMPVVQWLDHD